MNLFITEQELRAKVAERTINSIRVFIRVLFRPGGLFPFDFVDAFDIGYVPHDRLQLVETVNMLIVEIESIVEVFIASIARFSSLDIHSTRSMKR